MVSLHVLYEKDTEAEELTGYDLDKKLGRPHPFIDPKVRKPIKEPLTSEELWWNWRKLEKEQWSRWQKKRPDAETVSKKLDADTYPNGSNSLKFAYNLNSDSYFIKFT